MEKKDCAYTAEWQQTIDQLRAANWKLKSFEYFLELGSRQGNGADLAASQPALILLGLNYPDEILSAARGTHVYLAGGSFTASEWSEYMVPRDTDSATKAILGMLTNEEWNLAQNALVLIPITCDSMRKLAHSLKNEMNILPIEIPSDQHDPYQAARWKDEVKRILRAIEKHTHRRVSARELRRQCMYAAAARNVWNQLNNKFLQGELRLTGSARMFVANSYFWADDVDEWAHHVHELMEEALDRCPVQVRKEPSSVLLIGSPIYAPNYKIPFLLEELGIQIKGSVHPTEALLSAQRDACHRWRTRENIVEALAEDMLRYDMSPSFTENETMMNQARELLENHHFDGVVFHILKGQIEYDFELAKMDEYLTERNLPIFRLETDYNYQDIEQLRIRLEAFGEMLAHRADMRRDAAVANIA